MIIVVAVLGIGAWTLTRNSAAPYSPSPQSPQMEDTTRDRMATTTPDSSGDNSGLNMNIGVSSTVHVSSVKEFTVTGQNYSFTPSTLTVNKGDTVKITFKNADGFHDFRIDEFNVATNRISGGSEESVTFVADKTGTFEYYCSVANHRAMGMKGTLTVK